MSSPSREQPPKQSPLVAWLLLLVALLLFAGVIGALTLALFGAKEVIEPYLVPVPVGSTTGF